MIYAKIKKIINKKNDIQYLIDDVELSLPANHPLPAFQKRFPLYDRYLSFLLKALNIENHLIVDIGANCADSLALMAKYAPNNHYICIEIHKV